VLLAALIIWPLVKLEPINSSSSKLCTRKHSSGESFGWNLGAVEYTVWGPTHTLSTTVNDPTWTHKPGALSKESECSAPLLSLWQPWDQWTGGFAGGPSPGRSEAYGLSQRRDRHVTGGLCPTWHVLGAPLGTSAPSLPTPSWFVPVASVLILFSSLLSYWPHRCFLFKDFFPLHCTGITLLHGRSTLLTQG
jgi:hypothetical protein